MSRAVAWSTSLPKGLQPRPMAETNSPEAPSLRNCTAHLWQDFTAEASARCGKDIRRRVAAMSDDDDVIQAKANQLAEALGHVLRRSDDAEPIDEFVCQRRLVARTAGGMRLQVV